MATAPSTTGPSDGMPLEAFIAAREAIFTAAHAFAVPADCTHCTHYDMGDCKKHGQAVPKEFQQTPESCPDWAFDGIPF